jgi:hypothetical protein
LELGLTPEEDARLRAQAEASPHATRDACYPGCTMHPEHWCGLPAPHHAHVCEPTEEQEDRAMRWFAAFAHDRGRLHPREVNLLRAYQQRQPVFRVLPGMR